MNYIDYVIKNTPRRERALMGLGLKIMCARMNGDEELVSKIKMDFEKINSMSDEEYERMNNLNKK